MSQSAIKRPLAQLHVEPVEKVSGKIYLSDAEKSGIVECATMKISSLGPSVLSPNGKPFVAQVTSLSSRNACIIPNAKDRNSYFIEEAYIFDLSPKDRREIRQIIYQHFEYIEEQWDEFQRRLQK